MQNSDDKAATKQVICALLFIMHQQKACIGFSFFVAVAQIPPVPCSGETTICMQIIVGQNFGHM